MNGSRLTFRLNIILLHTNRNLNMKHFYLFIYISWANWLTRGSGNKQFPNNQYGNSNQHKLVPMIHGDLLFEITGWWMGDLVVNMGSSQFCHLTSG